MTTRACLIGLAAAVTVPAGLVVGVGVIVAGGAGSTGAAAAAATAVCTYAYPDADRLADAMARLTNEPVQPAQWERYANLAGIDPQIMPWDQSSDEQRGDVLRAAVRSLLFTNAPAAIMTPPIIWWLGFVPDDADTTWQATPVAGWNGTLGDYLAALADTYATDPDNTWDDHQCIQPSATSCGKPAEMSAILATIRHMESGDNYLNQSYSVVKRGRDRSGNATGAYAFIYTAWGGFGGYDEAFMAPPPVQDQRATDGVTAILSDFGGDPVWVPIAWYVGTGGAHKVQDGTWSTAYVPNPPYNKISIGDYQARWLDYYTTVALPAAGNIATECPQAGAAAVAWGDTQIGAPYVAASRYRFGDVPWPGGTHIGDRGKPYTFPAGTILYDCSGFVIRAWREAGIDLSARYGLYGSQQFPSSPLEEINPAAVIPGDLAVYSVDPDSGIGHIVMIHHVDPDGTVHVIEATPSKGVHIGIINWSRVTSIKRPANPSREATWTS
jgi:cell wall-associated NlpC family hydrolase